MSCHYSLTDFLKDINVDKKNLLRMDSEAHSDYKPYVVNMMLANSVDAVLTIDVLNKYPHVSKQMQYDFLIHSLPKKSRWQKNYKKVKEDEIELIAKYYKVNVIVARSYLDLLSKEQIQTIKDTYYKGGVL